MIQYRNCMKNMSRRQPVNILMTRWQEKYPPENVPVELIGLRDGRSPAGRIRNRMITRNKKIESPVIHDIPV